MKKHFLASFIVLALFNSSAESSVAAPTSKISKSQAVKPTKLPNIASVLVYDSNFLPDDGRIIKVTRSNSFTAKVVKGEKFQLQVTGLEPGVVASVIMISPKGLSSNLTPAIADNLGVLTLQFMYINQKGNYSILIKQPEKSKSSFLQIRVS